MKSIKSLWAFLFGFILGTMYFSCTKKGEFITNDPDKVHLSNGGCSIESYDSNPDTGFFLDAKDEIGFALHGEEHLLRECAVYLSHPEVDLEVCILYDGTICLGDCLICVKKVNNK